MPAKVIGKALPFGFAGNVSGMNDCVIKPYVFPVDTSTASETIQFGQAVVLDTALKGVRPMRSGDAANTVIGIAVRHIGQPKSDNVDGWYYAPGETVDVLIRGTITVELGATTGIAMRGAVYADPDGKNYAATASGRVAIPGAEFVTGVADGDSIVEIVIKERAV